MKSNWYQYRGLNIKIGLIISLGLALAAFEWKTYDPPSLVILDGDLGIEETLPPIPITKTTPPPPPKIMPEIKEVPDTEPDELLDDVIIDLPDEPIDISTEPLIIEDEPEDEPTPPDFYLSPEVHASPKNGLKGFLGYVSKNVKYPRQAKRMGVEGRVIVEFMVNERGEITNIKVLRGIGAGCDEEAVRVLSEAPAWNPAKQRGRPVKQKMTFPVFFKLK